ncbi:MAG: sulfite exporter TauE/SafE family protein [Pseudomonadota bacterium]
MELLLLIVAAFLTSAVSATIGMAGGVTLLGIMTLFFPSGYQVVAMHGVIQLFSNVIRTFMFRKHLKSYIVKNFLPWAIVGLMLSAGIILLIIYFAGVIQKGDLKLDFIKPLIGIFILWFLFGKRFKINVTEKSYRYMGVISGIASVFVGATGPLIAPFFIKDKLTKNEVVANKAFCQSVNHLGKLPIFYFLIGFNYFAEMDTLLPLIAAVIVGTWLGKRFLSFIPERIFQIIFKVLLSLIAMRLILEQVIKYISS